MNERIRTDWREVDLTALSRERFGSLSLAEKIDLRDFLFEKRDRIEGQVTKAKSWAHTTGEYAEYDWFTKATEALRITNRQLAKLNQVIAAEKKALRQSEARTFEVAFMTVCRESLEPAVYQSMITQARAYCNGG